MKKLLFTLILTVSQWGYAHNIDFEKITNWTGEGENRAALAIQFNNDVSGTVTRVWGYRWGDDETPTGEDMFRAIASNTKSLVLFTQFTGVYGSTVCGIGYDESGNLIKTIWFDFEGAKDCEDISFDYYHVNSWMGQKEAPGDNTPKLAQEAIDAALTTHIIQHPIDQRNYGYPAYDYDFWQVDKSSPEYNPNDEWCAGWYKGYWSYWTGSVNSSDLGYSGTGYSGRQLSDGAIDGWSYSNVAAIGEGTPPGEDEIIYVPADNTEACPSISVTTSDDCTVYDLYGQLVGKGNLHEIVQSIPNGIYIMLIDGKTSKVLINK